MRFQAGASRRRGRESRLAPIMASRLERPNAQRISTAHPRGRSVAGTSFRLGLLLYHLPLGVGGLTSLRLGFRFIQPFQETIKANLLSTMKLMITSDRICCRVARVSRNWRQSHSDREHTPLEAHAQHAASDRPCEAHELFEHRNGFVHGGIY